MTKTLVIILSETRAHELTFDNIKKNLIDELNADLCLCIGIKPDYDYNNSFYKLAKYKFLYNEPDDFGDAFDYAYNILSENKPKYECLKDINLAYGKISTPKQSTENINFYGNIENIRNMDELDSDVVVVHTKNFPDSLWKNQVYGIKNGDNKLVSQKNVDTYKKPLHWREFLKIKYQFLGGIKDSNYQHPGSGGILIFFRWFLLKNLIESNVINEYDRFVITRSDYIYQLPHPKVEFMDKKKIWIPDGEHWGGYTDRHVILSRNNIEPYLNILNNFVLRSNEYFMRMKSSKEDAKVPLPGDLSKGWNLEQLIRFHLQQNKVDRHVKEFPYVMYTIRDISGSTRWTKGIFNKELGYCIKYPREFSRSKDYRNKFKKLGLSIDEFYRFLYTNKNSKTELSSLFSIY